MWAADIAVDAALAAKLIAAQFPGLRDTAVEPFGVGWDNTAFLVGSRVVFRFPRRRVSANLIEREVAILPLVAPHVPLAIPAPRYAGVPSAEYPWAFAGYDLIAGTSADVVDLSDDARAALAEPLGRFLRALHAVDTAPLVARGLPPDEIGRLDHHKRLPLAVERLAALAESPSVGEHGRGDRAGKLHRLARRAPARAACRRRAHARARRPLRAPRPARRARAPERRDRLGRRPPRRPRARHRHRAPRPACVAHAAFRAAYGAIDERTWEAARYRAIYHAILELDYGVRAGRRRHARERRAGAAADRNRVGR